MYGLGEKMEWKKCYERQQLSVMVHQHHESRSLSLPLTLCATPRTCCSLEMKREAGVGMHYVKSGAALIKHRPVPLTVHSCVTFVKRRTRSTQHYVKKNSVYCGVCNNITAFGLKPTVLDFKICKMETCSESSTITRVK